MSTETNLPIDDFRAQFRGEIVIPESENYDDVRAIWNAMIDKRPTIIARCTGVADVIAAVNFGRDNGLDIAVRGAGHNIAGKGTCDNGLMIDLSNMTNVRVDPTAKRAYVSPGALLGDVDHETAAHNLVVPTGINSTTGIAGLTLGGGMGWLTRSYGMTIDNLVSVEIVTAKGEVLKASTDENSDLFWAVRGGGGNFGVVTLFEFKLHDFDPNILAGIFVFSQDEAESVLKSHRDFVDAAPDALSLWTVLRKAPPLPFLSEEHHGKDVVIMPFCYNGDPNEGEKLIASVRNYGTILGEHVGVMPFRNWQQAFDPLLTAGMRNYWKSHDFDELKDGALEAVIDYAGRLPSGHSEIFIASIGGASAKISSGATAYSNRDARFVLNVHTRWETPEEDELCVAWARDFFEATKPFATGGVYVNFLSEGESDRIANAYGTNYARLAEIKRQYDPENLFRINQNIKPN